MSASTPSRIESLPGLKEKSNAAYAQMGRLSLEISILDARIGDDTDTSSPAYLERERVRQEYKEAETAHLEALDGMKGSIAHTRSLVNGNQERMQELNEKGQIALARMTLATNEISALDELIGASTDKSNQHYVERENLRRIRREAQAECDAALKEMKVLSTQTETVVHNLKALPADIVEPPALPLAAKESTTVWWLLGGMAVGAGAMITALASGAFNAILGF